MEFSKYLTSLLPTLGKDRILEDLDIQRDQIRDTITPTYAAAAEFFKKHPFQSALVKKMNDEFIRQSKVGVRGNMIVQISHVWENTLRGLDVLDQMIEKNFGRETAQSGMTYLRANLLMHIEAVGFAMTYARKLLLWVYASETASYTKDGEPLTGNYGSKKEREWMQVHWADFIRVMTLLGRPHDELSKTYGSIPNAVIDPNRMSEIQTTVGAGKIDPMKHGYISSHWWPLYHLRIRIAEWQVLQRDRAKEELQAIQFRLLQLKQAQMGKPNARIDKEVEYYENEASKLSRKIAKIEGRG